MARDANVKVVLQANDQASAPIKNFQGTLRSVKGEIGGLDDALGDLAGGFGSLAAIGGIGGALALGQGAYDLARHGAEIEALAGAYESLAAQAGTSGAAMLQKLRDASRGTISDFDLMQSANRAMMLGVSSDADQMAALLEQAAARGRAFGMTTQQAFSDLVTGIGRASPMILDNLGITVDADRVFQDYAKGIGKAADSLTDFERKQALVNMVLSQPVQMQAALPIDSFERAEATVQNFKDGVARDLTISGALMIDYFTMMGHGLGQLGQVAAEGLGFATPAIEEQHKSLARLEHELAIARRAWQEYNNAGDEAAAASTQTTIDNLTIAIDEQRRALEAVGGGMEFAIYNTQMLARNQEVASGAVDALTQALWDQAAAASAALDKTQAAIAGRITGAYQGLAPDIGSGRAQEMAAAATEAVDTVSQALLSLGYDTANVQWQLETTGNIGIEAGRKVARGFETSVTAARSFGSAIDPIQERLEALSGRALSAIQSATQLDVGLDPASFLPREDAVNENARRLVDIMANGLTGQDWLGEFQREAPQAWFEVLEAMETGGDVQGVAARILQDFQAGLRPELLDMSAIKGKIKNEIAGESAMAATAAQITAELVADTGGDSADIQAKVNKALGLGIGGAEITDNILGELGSATFTSKLTTMAGGAGKQWGQSFLNTVAADVPIELIMLLSNLITPQVRAALAQDASLTGPLP